MIPLAIIAALMLASAALAMTRRNLIHAALLLIVTWASIACFYLWAGAEFVAFGQILIYVGAVSMVVLFAVLLTRPTLADPDPTPASRRRVAIALLAGAALLAVLAYAILNTPFALQENRPPHIEVRQLGFQLMGPHAASLLVAGVILTVALIGATIIAATDGRDGSPSRPPRPPNPRNADI
jgi:NADH-quinone oxidoreductase subunit J